MIESLILLDNLLLILISCLDPIKFNLLGKKIAVIKPIRNLLGVWEERVE